MTSLVGKRLGNYDIQNQIGEGGMGAVYLGHHPTIGKRVAIKVLHEELCEKPDVVTRFFNEAKAVNDINHPNIVDIIDFGDTTFDGKSCKYIIMEFLDGESLSARMRREGVTIRETLSIVSQCGGALAASHAKGVIHRDLKPENVFLCNRPGDRNYVKLLDFGIAKLTSEQGQAMSQKTRTGMVIGTPTYMSPEQCDGKGNIDARADIYALGVMMYELLTGRVPFPGDGFGEVLVAHLTREPDPPRSINPNIPAELEAIVLRCMRKRREERFQQMNDLLAAVADPGPHLQTFLQGLPAPVAGSAPMLPPSGAMPMMQSSMSGGQMGQNPLGTGAQAALRSPSAVWRVIDPNMPPGMQPGMQPQMPMQMMQSGPQMMPPMQMVQGGQRVPTGMTGMMMAPGMAGQMGPDMMAVQGAAVPRSTTLSGASAEQSGRRRPLNVLIGFIGAMIIGALVVVGARLASNRNATTNVPQPEAQISVVVKSNPPDAEVYRSDELNEVGRTPYTFKVKKGGKPIELMIRLTGYHDESRTVSLGEDQKVDLTLAKDAPSEPAQPSETVSKPKRRHVADAKEGDVETKPAKEPKEKPAKEPKESKDSLDKPAKAIKEPKEKPAKDDAKDEKPKKKKGGKSEGGSEIMRPIF
jgi:serine/threonine-protein kinase